MNGVVRFLLFNIIGAFVIYWVLSNCFFSVGDYPTIIVAAEHKYKIIANTVAMIVISDFSYLYLDLKTYAYFIAKHTRFLL